MEVLGNTYLNKPYVPPFNTDRIFRVRPLPLEVVMTAYRLKTDFLISNPREAYGPME